MAENMDLSPSRYKGSPARLRKKGSPRTVVRGLPAFVFMRLSREAVQKIPIAVRL